MIVPTRVRDYVEQYKICRNKVVKLRKVALKRFYEDRIRYTNYTNPKSGGTTSKCYLVYHSSQQSLASVLANGSILVHKQLADVIVDLDQVRHSMGQSGRKNGKPSERLQGETDLAQLQCFKYLGLGEIILIELMLFSTVLVRKLNNLVLTSYDVLPFRKKSR